MGEPGAAPEHKIRQSPRYSDSLVLASLELGKILADRRATTFRARGTCMYPSIHPNDILHIDSRSVKEVAVGDIAVCRRERFLFGHRTIDKGTHNGTHYIITRPDRMMQGSDGPTYNNDVLGVVSSIDRNGKRIDPARRQYPSHKRFYFSTRLKLIECSLALRRRLIEFMARFQQRSVYQLVIRSLLAAKCSKLSFTVELPFVEMEAGTSS